jgi:ribosomal protein S24E
MFLLKSLKVATCLAVVLFCLSSSFYCSSVSAQTGESVAELKAKVYELTEQTKYLEALPLLEKLVVAEPDNAQMHFYLGFSLIAHANNTQDTD